MNNDTTTIGKKLLTLTIGGQYRPRKARSRIIKNNHNRHVRLIYCMVECLPFVLAVYCLLPGPLFSVFHLSPFLFPDKDCLFLVTINRKNLPSEQNNLLCASMNTGAIFVQLPFTVVSTGSETMARQ